MILFAILLAIGIWGLSVYTERKSLSTEVRNNLIYSGQHFNIADQSNKHRKELEWLQKRFSCCGIDSYLGKKLFHALIYFHF